MRWEGEGKFSWRLQPPCPSFMLFFSTYRDLWRSKERDLAPLTLNRYHNFWASSANARDIQLINVISIKMTARFFTQSVKYKNKTSPGNGVFSNFRCAWWAWLFLALLIRNWKKSDGLIFQWIIRIKKIGSWQVLVLFDLIAKNLQGCVFNLTPSIMEAKTSLKTIIMSLNTAAQRLENASKITYMNNCIKLMQRACLTRSLVFWLKIYKPINSWETF